MNRCVDDMKEKCMHKCTYLGAVSEFTVVQKTCGRLISLVDHPHYCDEHK